MFFMKNYSKSIIIIIINFFLFLYFLEFILFLTPNQIYSNIQNKTNSFDTRVKLEVINDLKKKNSNVYPLFIPSYYLDNNIDDNLFPLSGVANSINVACNETGEWFIYNSDKYGFNNQNDNWEKKIDIAILGDSFVLGECVNDNFLKLIKKKTDKNIINLGVSGAGPLIQLAIFREYVKLQKPKKVIIFFFYNDFSEFENEMKNDILKNYLENKNFTQKLVIQKKIVEDIKKKRLDLAKKNYVENSISYSLLKFLKISKFRQLVNLIRDKTSKKRPKCSEFIFRKDYNRDIVQVYDSIKKDIEEHESELTIINLPSYFSVFCSNFDYENKISSLKELLLAKNINFIDMTNSLKKNKYELFAYPYFGSHYSKEGNKILFKELLNIFKTK